MADQVIIAPSIPESEADLNRFQEWLLAFTDFVPTDPDGVLDPDVQRKCDLGLLVLAIATTAGAFGAIGALLWWRFKHPSDFAFEVSVSAGGQSAKVTLSKTSTRESIAASLIERFASKSTKSEKLDPKIARLVDTLLRQPADQKGTNDVN